MLVDGILSNIGEHSVVIAQMKNTGMGLTIGYFAWGTGKEFFSFQAGDISYEEMLANIKERGKIAGTQAFISPVNMLVLKIVGGGLSGTVIVPVVIIGGGFIIQRTQKWYQDKVWENTIYTDDVTAILGPDLVNEFTLVMPTLKSTIVSPERKNSLAET
jgi:hypothetical protein